jgi:AcrR family transcriptional regulator
MPAQRPSFRRTAHGLASRERILDMAVELFAERGYAATPVDLVCRRADTTPTALYWHFGSKEGLLAAALDRVAGAWIESIQKSVYMVGDPMERLDRAIDGLRSLVEDHPHLLRLMLLVMLERGDSDPQARATLQRIFDRARAAVTAGIQDAVGPIRDADLIAHVAISLLQGAALRRQLEPADTDLERIFRFARRTLALLVADRASASGIEVPARAASGAGVKGSGTAAG